LLAIKKHNSSEGTLIMSKTNRIFLILLSIIFILLNSGYLIEIPEETSSGNFIYSYNPLVTYDFRQLRDTVYTEKDHYIEVNLATQFATLYLRDGSEFRFPVSSGTTQVEKGMETI
jgi:hypothetical protein